MIWQHIKAFFRGDPNAWLEGLIAKYQAHTDYHVELGHQHSDAEDRLREAANHSGAKAIAAYTEARSTQGTSSALARLLLG